MILWDQQGGSLDLYLRVWDDSSGTLVLGPAIPLDDDVSQAAYSADGFFGEAAVNLTATIFGGTNACLSFANTIPSTVTGNPTPRTTRTRSCADADQQLRHRDHPQGDRPG